MADDTKKLPPVVKPQMTLCPRCRGKKKFCSICSGKRWVPIKALGIKRS